MPIEAVNMKREGPFGDPANRDRLMVLRVSAELIVELLRQPERMYEVQVVENPIPQDAEVVNIGTSYSDTVNITLCSVSFTPVAATDVPPVLCPVYRQVTRD